MTFDWRDGSQYPDPADTSLHRWAWEFLRRNPAFCAEAEPAGEQNLALKAAGKLPKAWHKTPLGTVMHQWGIRDPNLSTFRQEARGHRSPVFDRGPWSVKDGATLPQRYRIEFDLAAPIDPQIERARSMLAYQQRFHVPGFRRKRNRVEKFPAYLRVLDAQAAGATIAQILAAMATEFPEGLDERTVRYWIKSATALRDEGYRKLLTQ